MMADLYRVRVKSELSDELLATLDPVVGHVAGGQTVFICRVSDRPELFGMLARCDMLGLDLIECTRTTWEG